jgi:hypothetical protein
VARKVGTDRRRVTLLGLSTRPGREPSVTPWVPATDP